jgi:hypothetical protein
MSRPDRDLAIPSPLRSPAFGVSFVVTALMIAVAVRIGVGIGVPRPWVGIASVALLFLAVHVAGSGRRRD